jgi:hypothetical protein
MSEEVEHLELYQPGRRLIGHSAMSDVPMKQGRHAGGRTGRLYSVMSRGLYIYSQLLVCTCSSYISTTSCSPSSCSPCKQRPHRRWHLHCHCWPAGHFRWHFRQHCRPHCRPHCHQPEHRLARLQRTELRIVSMHSTATENLTYSAAPSKQSSSEWHRRRWPHSRKH